MEDDKVTAVMKKMIVVARARVDRATSAYTKAEHELSCAHEALSALLDAENRIKEALK